MIQSTTAVRHGAGSYQYRWVSGLTDTEREAVRNGEVVWFITDKYHYMQSGYKVATYWHGKYGFREPNERELAIIQEVTA